MPGGYNEINQWMPMTQKGDLLVRFDSYVGRLPAGSDGQVLTVNASAPAGVAWANSSGTDLEFANLSDIDINGATSNGVTYGLTYDSTTGGYQLDTVTGATSLNLNDLLDVNTAGATTNATLYGLRYDSSGGGVYDLDTIGGGGTGDMLESVYDPAGKAEQVLTVSDLPSTFVTTYKGSVPFVRDFVGTHDASGGGAPSYTSAKRGDLAVITVAGTVDGTSVARGDLLQANQDSPTTGAHWDIIKDCTADFETAIEAAAGSQVKFPTGTYLLQDADPDARINITCDRGTVTILNRLDHSVINQISNDTYATTNTTQVTVNTVTQENYTAPLTGNATDYVTVFTCATPSQAANFPKDSLAFVSTNKSNPYTAAESKKNLIGEAFIVLDNDPVTGKVYAGERLAWHPELAALNGAGSDVIKLNTLNGDRRTFIENFRFEGAPTVIGNSAGWWNTLFGTQVTATITASSGATRTITSNGHNIPSGYSVQVGTVSGSTNTSCLVSNVTTNTFDITVPATEDYTANAPSIPTSGTIYYRPAYDPKDTDHHGDVLCLRHASFSEVNNCIFDRNWMGGIRTKWCSFMRDSDNQFLRSTSANTDSHNLGGRICYARHNYGGCKNNHTYRPVGKGGRHMYTDAAPESSASFNASNWYKYCGAPVGCMVFNMVSDGATGGPADTHEGSNNTWFINPVVINPNRGAHEGSYFGHMGQARGSNQKYIGAIQYGGSFGVRIVNSINQANSVHTVEGSFYNLWDDTGFSAALWVQGQTSTPSGNRHKVVGKIRADNCGWGIYLQDLADVNLSEYVYHNITVMAAKTLDNSKLHIDVCHLDYSRKPVSSQTSRYGFWMEDASQITIGTLIVTRGDGTDEPDCIFYDNDNVSGKKVAIGKVIYRDPNNLGPIPLVRAGREANFTWLDVGEMHPPGGAIRAATNAGATLTLQAYDTDGSTYTTFGTLTSNTTPTFDLASSVTKGGNYIYSAGGTDVSLADGGTGSSLTDPNADRIMFWDDDAGQVTWLTPGGGGLNISGTTLQGPQLNIPFHCAANANATWTSMPSALSFLLGDHKGVTYADLTNYTQARIVVHMRAVAGVSGSKLILRYRSSDSTTATDYSDIGTSEVSATIDAINITTKSAWVDLAAGAKGDVLIAVMGSGGDGTVSPTIGSVHVQFR